MTQSTTPLDPRSDTLPKIILGNARRMPEAIAMRRKSLGIWQRISWRELGDNVRHIGAGLMAMGLAEEPCIVAIGDNEPELFWAEYAIQATGRAAVCLYPDLSSAEILSVLENSNARVIFAEDQEQCDKILEIADAAKLRKIIYWDPRGMTNYADPRVMDMADLMRAGAEHLAGNPDAIDERVATATADDLAVIIYTSGTTGKPKGVMGSHRYLLDCADRWRRVLDARAGANYVSYISPAWATEQYLGMTLCAIMPMVVNFPEEPETVNADMREIGAEFLFFGSRQWEEIVSSTEQRIHDASAFARFFYRRALKAMSEGNRENASAFQRFKRQVADLFVGRQIRDRLGFSYLRTAVNSGSVLSPEVFDLFHALGVSLRNVYGFTEIGIVTATKGERHFDTVGQPLSSAFGSTPLEMRIHDNEIQVRGGVIFSGYYGARAETDERYTADGWVRSGDAGMINDEGYLVYLDRLEDLMKLSTGATVAPQFIETRMRLSPYIRDVITVGDKTRDYLTAMVDIDMELVGRWAEERKIPFSAHADLSQREEVYALIEKELAGINARLPDNCRIERFVNLFKPLDADEGELTRSRKLRRSVIADKYGHLIEALYGTEKTMECAIEVRFQDGRTRVMTSNIRVWDVDAGPARDSAAKH